MPDTFKNQTRKEFRQRIRRVDPVYYRWGESGALADATARRPIASVLVGFGWAYLVIAVSSNRTLIESSLRQGNLPDHLHGYVFMGLAALLTVSVVMLGLHLFRFFFKQGGKRANSGGMLIGVLGAMMLVYTPASVWDTSFRMLDGNSRSLLLSASATVGDVIPGIDLSDIALVSSQGR